MNKLTEELIKKAENLLAYYPPIAIVKSDSLKLVRDLLEALRFEQEMGRNQEFQDIRKFLLDHLRGGKATELLQETRFDGNIIGLIEDYAHRLKEKKKG